MRELTQVDYERYTASFFSAIIKNYPDDTHLHLRPAVIEQNANGNYIASFTIKECPLWIFGILWDDAIDSYNNISGILFAQHFYSKEEFTPEQSTHKLKISCSVDRSRIYPLSSILSIISAIRDEPAQTIYDTLSLRDKLRCKVEGLWK